MKNPFKLLIITALLLLVLNIGQYLAYSSELEQIEENHQSKSDANFITTLETFETNDNLEESLQNLSALDADVNSEQLEDLVAQAEIQNDEYFNKLIRLISFGDLNGDLAEKEFSINQYMLSSETQKELIRKAYFSHTAILNLLYETIEEYDQSEEAFAAMQEKLGVASEQVGQINTEINQLQSVQTGEFPPAEEVEMMKASLMHNVASPLVLISDLTF
ncbi:hypothetical protein [Planococcus salinarum]|uniref:hypothetical protein n=1 Tax=Planococcus salinarum TaxID=622695 RepID=UPI00115CABA4|nr:hypothetical protein [Planococcus salinarum]TAA69217.1 hypothetical protein D2909_12975 [Planococcus salinarum]